MHRIVATDEKLGPLKIFYGAQAELPKIKWLPGERVPQPQRQLLVHQGDMTPTLASYHKDEILLRVLNCIHEPTFYAREVVLFRKNDLEPVEFGAISIELERFPPDAREQIVSGRIPLGTILAQYAIEHASCPKAYFSIRSDEKIAQALNEKPGTTLYGRCNTHRNRAGQALAEIVEILPLH